MSDFVWFSFAICELFVYCMCVCVYLRVVCVCYLFSEAHDLQVPSVSLQGEDPTDEGFVLIKWTHRRPSDNRAVGAVDAACKYVLNRLWSLKKFDGEGKVKFSKKDLLRFRVDSIHRLF